MDNKIKPPKILVVFQIMKKDIFHLVKKYQLGEYTNKKGELKDIMYEIRFIDTFII